MSLVVIEIGDDYYAMLGISREDLAGLGESEVKKKIRDISKEVTRPLVAADNRGDPAAKAERARINEAADILKDREKRERYERENPGLALFAIQNIMPPYMDLSNRMARKRLVSRLLVEAGVEGTLRSFTDLDRDDFAEDLTGPSNPRQPGIVTKGRSHPT